MRACRGQQWGDGGGFAVARPWEGRLRLGWRCDICVRGGVREAAREGEEYAGGGCGQQRDARCNVL